MTDEERTLGDTLGEMYDKVKGDNIEGKAAGISLSFTELPDSNQRPWFGPGAGMGEDETTYMPHASTALLQIGDLLPPIDPISRSSEEAERLANMSEEEWLRELARRVLTHAEKFGGSDRQVKRELTLAARMLDGYAVTWENRNRVKREHPSQFDDGSAQ